MPDSFEFPRMLVAVVPHMGRKRLARFWRDVVRELIALALRHPFWSRRRLARRQPRLEPRFPAVIRPLNDLPKPTAGLRRINPVRIHRRPLEVIHFPPRKMRSTYLPFLPLRIRSKNKRPLPRADQYSYSTHA